MKILKRNYEHRNLILFLILSLVYLQAIYSLATGVSVLNLATVKSFFSNHYVIFILTLVTMFMVLNIKQHSDKILLLCLAVIAGKNFIMLAGSFNKLILGLNFVYLIFAFYFFVTWELEIAKASYNPLFSKHDLEKETRLHLRGTLEDLANNESYDLYVTNIDENSCFVILPESQLEKAASGLNPDHSYRLVAEYEGVRFVHNVELASKYDRGIGLNFIREKREHSVLNWSDLCKVCLERGHFQ